MYQLEVKYLLVNTCSHPLMVGMSSLTLMPWNEPKDHNIYLIKKAKVTEAESRLIELGAVMGAHHEYGRVDVV